MQLFISHSWKDKSTAQLMAEALRPYAEVWLDVQQLNPGDAIQDVIDHALDRMDVVIVAWSAHAASSSGVAAEIRTATTRGRRVLPVLLDGTPLPAPLAGLYGIDFDSAEPKAGLFRIQAALARVMVAPLDLDAAAALNDLTTFNGFYQYVDGYRNRQGIAGTDSAEWALRSLEQCNQTYRSVSALRDEAGETLRFMQDVLGRVEAAGNDRAALQAVLADVRRHPRSQSRDFAVLATFVEGKLHSLPPAPAPAPPAIPAEAPATAAAFARRVAARSLPASAPAPRAVAADPSLTLMRAYIEAAPVALGHFMRVAAASGSPALAWAGNQLHAYLTNPHDLIPDEQHGLFGLMDDAWLIHNTIYRCIEAGLFAADQVPIDWTLVVRGDALIVANLPPDVRAALDQLLTQCLQVIAGEVQQYQPRFTPQPAYGGDGSYGGYGGYGAFMGGGEAVEAGSGPQSVDDLFVGGGGQVTWVGKTW